MKRILVILLTACLCLSLCGCLKKNSTPADDPWDSGYSAGYESGYKAGKEEAGDKLYSELSRAAEKVNRALCAMEDLPEKAYKIDGMDNVYDALCKADDILSKYR